MGLVMRYRLTLVGMGAVLAGGLSVFVPHCFAGLPPGDGASWGQAVAGALRLAPAGWGAWVMVLGAFIVAAAVGTGLAVAYRRGLEIGGRREGERKQALAVLLQRADRFDSH